MTRRSLQRRLFLLVVIVTIPIFTVHEAIELRSVIRAASEHTATDTRDVATAAIPLLKSTLIVDDLATAQETLDSIMQQGHFRTLRLLAPNGTTVLVDATATGKSTAEQAPAWFTALLNLRFAAQPFAIEAGGVHYGTLVAEPSSQYLVATIWELTWIAVVFWLATLASALALLRHTLRKSLRPLDDLAQAAHRLGQGDLESRVPVSEMPELAETANAFNRMADSLASAHNQLEARVRQATLDLENLVTRIPVGVYKLRLSPDDSMHFDYVSPRWCELLELDAETLNDDPRAPLSRLHPDEVDAFTRDFDRAKAGPTHFQWEGRLRDGMHAGWLRIEAMPTLLDNGDVLWEGIQYDVTARKQAEEALRIGEEKLRGLYELSPLGIALTDMQGHYIEFNEAFRAICGYPADELRQLDYWTLTPRKYQADEQRQLESLRLTERYGPYEKEYLRKDGQLVPLNLNGMLVKDRDGQPRIWSIVEDITDKKRNEDDLRRLKQALTHASEAFLTCDPEYRVQYVNPSFEQLFGYTLAEIRDQLVSILQPTDSTLAPDNPVVLSEFTGERLRRAKDGHLIPVLLKVSPIIGDEGALTGFVGTMTDLTAIKAAEATLRDTLRELDNLIARIPAGVYKLRTTPAGGMHFDYVSPRWCQLLEITEEEVYRDPLSAFTRIHPDDLGEFRRLNASSLANRTPFHWEGRLRDGMRIRWLHIESAPTLLDNGDTLWEGIQYDITATKSREEALDHIAHYDALTGLPNRMLLADRLHQAIAQSKRSHTSLAVCYLDLDGFKPVNDNLGHGAGDTVLMEVARRLLAAVRGGDTVARIGGDEFVLLLSGMSRMDEFETTLGRLLDAINAPIAIDIHVVSVSASIGIALYPKDAADPDILLRHADHAMYQAKQAGRNKFIFFDALLEDAARRHREQLRQIETGLERGEFELHYQPKVNMRLGAVVGYEALIRWNHPDRGLLLPQEFLHLIQDNTLIVTLGEWAIDQALTQLSLWHGEDIDVQVSVNIAAHHLQQDNFAERLRFCLACHPEVSPQRLEIEIVETAALSDMAGVAKLIDDCRRLGVTFSLDDFGAGYSSLTYLKNLPAQTLKIDQSFVIDMLTDANDLAIVEGVIELTGIFGRQVIAEGVESVEHGLLLLNMDCDLGQGNAIARPMPAQRVADWQRAWQPDPVWRSLSSQRWSHDDRPLVIAQYYHREWVDKIAAYVDGAMTTAPELTSANCRFGQWYGDGGQRRYGHLPEFAAIGEVHEQIHHHGKKLVELTDLGRHDDARARLPELHALRDTLLTLLRQLMQATTTGK